jgi:iron complex transport system permease protein
MRRKSFLIPMCLLLIVICVSLFLGRYPAPGLRSPRFFAEDPLYAKLLLHLRLPRLIAALLLGCGLAAAGTVFQMLFSNPLVEPGFLGISQGAAFGAALSIVVIGANPFGIQVTAFICALAALTFSYYLARLIRYGGWILRLILAGIAVSALFSAGIGLLKLVADPMGELPEITFWLLGGLWSVGWNDILYIAPPSAAGLLILFLFRWKLNVLSLDDRVAHSLGSSPRRDRLLLLFTATLVTSVVISVSGLIGWAGLMVPHAARRIYGSDARRALPASMLLGAIFMLICDDIARVAAAGELPLGILTSLTGAVIFLILMITGKKARGG